MAFGEEAFLLAYTTFIAEVLALGLFFPLLFILAAMLSWAASSNLLVPPTIATNNGVGPFGACGGAPLVRRVGGVGTVEGCWREDWAWGAAITCAGGRCATLCDRSRRLDWI